MVISPDKLPDWTSKDAEFLESFLTSSTGLKIQGILAFQCPEILDGSDTGKALVASGVVKGYHRAVESFLSLTKALPVSAPTDTSAYPSLDDESQWNDKN